LQDEKVIAILGETMLGDRGQRGREGQHSQRDTQFIEATHFHKMNGSIRGLAESDAVKHPCMQLLYTSL